MYRITKYTPQNRDANGAYLLNDWTSVSDIGRTFNGTILNEPEYLKVEDAYVGSALFFLRENRIFQMMISSLEKRDLCEPGFESIKNGQVFGLEDLEKLFRFALREKFWCRFRWRDQAYIHFGYDYYMYIGVSRLCEKAITFAEQQGLFVESFSSPYLKKS